jgi:hypothetical protein
MTAWGASSLIQIVSTIQSYETANPAPDRDRPFLWGFSPVSFRSFGLR